MCMLHISKETEGAQAAQDAEYYFRQQRHI